MKEMVVGSRVRLLDASMVSGARCLSRPQVASAPFQFAVYARGEGSGDGSSGGVGRDEKGKHDGRENQERARGNAWRSCRRINNYTE